LFFRIQGNRFASLYANDVDITCQTALSRYHLTNMDFTNMDFTNMDFTNMDFTNRTTIQRSPLVSTFNIVAALEKGLL
jgi:uncharacterized protein YjbI with pentapeptide repeats